MFRAERARELAVKLTKSSSIDPQDTGLEPVVNPPYLASETAISLNLTILSQTTGARWLAGHRAVTSPPVSRAHLPSEHIVWLNMYIYKP